MPEWNRSLQIRDNLIADLTGKVQTLGEELQDHRECLISAMSQQGKDPLTYGKDCEISELKQKLAASRQVGKFTTGSTELFKALSSSQIQSRMIEIETEVDVITELFGDRALVIPANETTSSLTWRMVHRFQETRVRSTPSSGIDINLNPRQSLRVTIATAVCEWVFESDFPAFDVERSRVLAKYRQKLLNQGK